MPARPIHAARYIKPGAEGLVRIIQNDLWGFDFEETLDFYRWFETQNPRLTDRALLGANDRFYLLSGFCNRKDVLHPWLFDRCRMVEANPDGFLDLWARYHYKSTFISYAGTIQEIIRDPEITICIFSHTKDVARKFMVQVKRELEMNEALRLCYPDVLWWNPKGDSPKWSEDDGIVVIRNTNPREPTLMSTGLVDGMPTGMHFRLRIYNDVVVPASVTNADQIAKTTEMWELSDNLGVGEASRVWHEGTRYNLADTYDDIMKRGILTPRIFPITDNGRPTGNPVFVSRKEMERLQRTQRSTFAAQMLQNPASGKDKMFELAWCNAYDIRPALLHVYIMVDPASSKKKSSDRTAMAVIGVDVAKNKWLLDGFCHRMSLSERWKNLKALHRRWSAERGVVGVYVGYEKYGAQSDAEGFTQRMQDENYTFEIKDLGWTGSTGEQSKKDRVARLQPDVEGRDYKFYFPYYVYNQALGCICSWHFDEKSQTITYQPAEELTYLRTDPDGVPVFVSQGKIKETKAMMRLDQGPAPEPHRKARAIKRKDEDGAIYDLTMRFFEEAAYFPHRAGHDDLLDAMSRIYDMEYTAPTPFESTRIHNPAYLS